MADDEETVKPPRQQGLPPTPREGVPAATGREICRGLVCLQTIRSKAWGSSYEGKNYGDFKIEAGAGGQVHNFAFSQPLGETMSNDARPLFIFEPFNLGPCDGTAKTIQFFGNAIAPWTIGDGVLWRRSVDSRTFDTQENVPPGRELKCDGDYNYTVTLEFWDGDFPELPPDVERFTFYLDFKVQLRCTTVAKVPLGF